MRPLDWMMLDYGRLMGGGVDKDRGAMLQLQGARRRERMANAGQLPMQTVLPSPQWDGFFGAMQARENYANARGGRMRVDMMGEGPGSGTGFGRWKARVNGGTNIDLENYPGVAPRRSFR